MTGDRGREKKGKKGRSNNKQRNATAIERKITNNNKVNGDKNNNKTMRKCSKCTTAEIPCNTITDRGFGSIPE